MKKLSAVVLSLMLCVSVSFAARGGTSSSSTSSSKSTKSSSSSSSGNFGIGYSKIDINIGRFGNAVGLDQVAARYWFNDSIGADFALGFTTGDAQAAVLFSGKVIGSIFEVNRLTIYWLAGAGFGNYDPKNGGNSMSVVMINGGLGAEFYVIPCLSVLTEMGIRYTSVSANGTSFSQTGIFADWLPQAGVRFYF